MRVLGVDPSLTALGWALVDTGGPHRAACLSKGLLKTSSSQVFVTRNVSQREGLRDVLRQTRPDAVGIESPFFGGSYSEGMYGLFVYLNEALMTEGYDVVFVGPMQVKSWARELARYPAGWKMDKPEMVDAARRDGAGSLNHNIADAYLVGRMAGRFWELCHGVIAEGDLTSVERTTFTGVHAPQKGKHAGEIHKKGWVYREDDRVFLWSKVKQNGSEDEGSQAPLDLPPGSVAGDGQEDRQGQ